MGTGAKKVEYDLLQKAVPNKGGQGDKRIIDQKRSDVGRSHSGPLWPTFVEWNVPPV
jgi:hypothetical protein